MFKWMKYLKPYIGHILLVMLLVIIEVLAELSLPECVGNIVSKGFEQYGIDNCVPWVIDSKMRDDIVKLIDFQNKKLFLESYNKLVNENQLKKCKKLYNFNLDYINQNLYIMCNQNKNEINALEKSLIKVLSMLECNKNNHHIKSFIIKNTELNINESIIDQIDKMKDQDRMKTIIVLNNNCEEVYKTQYDILTDIVIKNIKDHYDHIGLNIKKLQKNYIKDTGVKMFLYILMADIPWVLIILISSYYSAGIAKNLRSDLFKKVNYLSKVDLDNFSVSSLVMRATNDITQVQTFLYFSLEAIFFAPMFGIMSFRRACSKSVEMSWVIIVVVVIMVLLLCLILTLVVPKYSVQQKLLDKINLITRENLTGLLSIRAFNTQKFEENRFDQTNKDLMQTNIFIERVMALIDPLIFLVTNLSIVVLIWISYKYILNYSLQVGDIIVYMNYIMFVITSFLMMSMMLVEFPRTYVSVKRILEVLNSKSSVVDDRDIVEKINFKGELVFNNVSFMYPGASKYILKDISFTAKPGQTTAIIGATGSGKSTIINLIPRLYDVTNGEILLDGVNIKKIPQHILRNQISYAPQNGVLFKGTIESNIKYGNDVATDEEMAKVIEIVQAKKFISEKDNKLLYEIAQRGSNISGGQRQRLSIARSIIKKSKIYIFDDSFSALDFKTDLELRKSLYQYIKDVNVIIIAQRISTILNADQIIVLSDGQIVGQGTHKELLENCEEYYKMALNQLPESLL